MTPEHKALLARVEEEIKSQAVTGGPCVLTPLEAQALLALARRVAAAEGLAKAAKAILKLDLPYDSSANHNAAVDAEIKLKRALAAYEAATKEAGR
jgi:hypothetical protein